MAFIRFAGTKVSPGSTKEDYREPDRGHFVDVKTLAVALTAESHSLKSLCRLLKVDSPKSDTEEHGKPVTPCAALKISASPTRAGVR
jgi:hypothetical protein